MYYTVVLSANSAVVADARSDAKTPRNDDLGAGILLSHKASPDTATEKVQKSKKYFGLRKVEGAHWNICPSTLFTPFRSML